MKHKHKIFLYSIFFYRIDLTNNIFCNTTESAIANYIKYKMGGLLFMEKIEKQVLSGTNIEKIVDRILPLKENLSNVENSYICSHLSHLNQDRRQELVLSNGKNNVVEKLYSFIF